MIMAVHAAGIARILVEEAIQAAEGIIVAVAAEEITGVVDEATAVEAAITGTITVISRKDTRPVLF